MVDKKMNVLSLFDGMSCGQIALDRAGIDVDNYFASEVDKYAIQITQKNYPETIQLGDIRDVDVNILPKIDLLIGGSPCTGFSNMGKGLNFDDPQSELFFEYVRILKECKPKYFLLENVRMKKEWQDVITNILGVSPIAINSSLVSAQNRPRLYWTNIPNVGVPKDKGIVLSDIIENGSVDRDKAYCLDANYFRGTNARRYFKLGTRQVVWQIPVGTKKGYIEVDEGKCVDLTFIRSKTRRGRVMVEKSPCLTQSMRIYKVTNDWFRKLTPLECERLQTVPEGYTEGVSNAQRYKMLGNGWTVDVIVHILGYLK
jgi:DNA (cytosine-5)-methyltransferase 3A